MAGPQQYHRINTSITAILLVEFVTNGFPKPHVLSLTVIENHGWDKVSIDHLKTEQPDENVV